VGAAVKACGFESGVNLAEIDRRKDKLDKEINDELYHSSDVYETKEIEGQQFFRFQVSFPPVYQHDRTTQPYPWTFPATK
jgi:MoxR-like ATPase